MSGNKVYLVRSSDYGNLGIFTSIKKVHTYVKNSFADSKLKMDVVTNGNNDAFTYQKLLNELKTGYYASLSANNPWGATRIEITRFNLNEKY